MEHLVYFRIAPENFKPVEEKLQKAKVVFDVGANIGGTTLLFAHKNPHAHIFSFEPHPVTYQKLQTNTRLNAFNKIHLVNKGLGTVKEIKKLYEVIDNNAGMNRIMPGENSYPFTLVEIITLDDFCREFNISFIDFIKIDVEGFEYFVLLGGKNIIQQSHPVVYLELYDHGLKKNGYSASALISLLFDMGYNYILNAYTLSPIEESTDLTNCDIDIIAEKI
jgi:FkbM family methyltransferase